LPQNKQVIVLADKKKLSITVEVQDDGGFKIELATGMLHKQHMVAETVESCVKKASDFLRTELAGSSA
jgi:hypothetical protein